MVGAPAVRPVDEHSAAAELEDGHVDSGESLRLDGLAEESCGVGVGHAVPRTNALDRARMSSKARA